MPACVVKEPNPTADRARIVEVFHLLSFESVGCAAPAAKKLSLSSPDPGLAAAAPAFFVEGFGREEDASSVRWLGEVVQDFRGDATHGRPPSGPEFRPVAIAGVLCPIKFILA